MTTIAATTRTTAQAPVRTPPTDPVRTAERLLAAHTTGGRVDVAGLRRDLDALAGRDAAGGAAVRSAVEARLTPVQRGQLASAQYALGAPDGRPLTISADAMPIGEKFAQAQGSPERQLYDRLDRVWGDGDPRTNDTAAIEAGIGDIIARGLTLAQVEAAPAAGAANGPATATLVADLTQMGLDLAGIVDPTGIADGSNAVISLGRSVGAAWNGEWRDAGGHLLNGGISVAGLLPLLGDSAKVAKIGKWADTVRDALSAIAHNPAARAALEPVLKGVHDALKAIPAGVLDKLPAAARESLDRMKGQLDELFGAARRSLDDIPVSELTHKTLIDNLGTLDVATRPNTAVFYSGRGAREAAESLAAAEGKITLETTQGGRALDDMRLFDGTVPDVNGDQAMEIWSQVSTRYAQEASGSVTAFVNTPRAGGVFLTKELPALLENGRVTDIVVRGPNGARAVIEAGTSLPDALAAIARLG